MKKIIFFSLVISLIGIFSSYIILGLDLSPSFGSDILVKLGKSLFYGMSALSLIFVVLLFIPQAFSAWKKFAVWFIPAAILLFVAYKTPGSGDFLSPYPEDVFRWVSYVYVIVSFVIIFINRKKA